ncbi:hypothetical protein BCR42DRAFT_429204 [Absidia repens]|uniref:Uncharacterized protein n=1 Tax=Absidia repens TaxID=90262 RepID=A0A1X2HXD7_9FUNG|nr:hypothetical protein BCR42DRAFT_429204 [Absidia repens]
MMVCLIHTVSAAECCDGLDTACCGKCGGLFDDGPECTIKGNPHDTVCGDKNCPLFVTENCDSVRGWKC